MTVPVIGLAGYMRSGKSTAAAHLAAAHGFAQVNFADALRDALAALDPFVDPWHAGVRYGQVVAQGYDGAKDRFPEVRRLLQVLGTEVGRNILGADVWVHAWRRRVVALGSACIVAADVRFPNEADAIRQAGGEVWWIGRPGCEPSGHASERSIGPGDCDAVVPNATTVDDLRRLLDANLA